MGSFFWTIMAGAAVTYLTRIGGHLILSRFERIHYRVEAGLNAVPAAVLTTLVAPPAFDHGWREFASLIVCLVLSLRLSFLPTFLCSAAVLVALRQFFPG